METRQRPSQHRHPHRHPRGDSHIAQKATAPFNHWRDDKNDPMRRRFQLPSRLSRISVATLVVVIGMLCLFPKRYNDNWTATTSTTEEMSSSPYSFSTGRELTQHTEDLLEKMPSEGKNSGSSSSSKHRNDNDRSQLRKPTAATKSQVHNTQNTPKLNGTMEPVIIRRRNDASIPSFWQPPTNWNQDAFLQRVGHYAQYLKDSMVQPYRDENGNFCIVNGTSVVQNLHNNILFFTNNQENEAFLKELGKDYKIPPPLHHINGFEVFSALTVNQSHSFHKHGESWLGQVEGRRHWWFLPPTTNPAPRRINACGYLNGKAELPSNAISFTQHPGDVVWFPKDWYHATCALDEWTVGIGWQQGPIIRQMFPQLNVKTQESNTTFSKLGECLPTQQTKKSTTAVMTPTSKTAITTSATQDFNNKEEKEWKWFDGDLNAYYNSLTTDENHKRDPNDVSSYAVHRWLGDSKNTETHYQLLYQAMERHLPVNNISTQSLRVMDAGCGLGAGLMWMEQHAPQWNLTGYTISEEQHKFISETLPPHRFQARLQSFDDLSGEKHNNLDVIYSIEALIHSENMEATLQEWTQHLSPGGVIVLIDDFLASDANKTEQSVKDFAKSWLANSLVSIPELTLMAQSMGLELVEDRDLVEEYKIIEVNYRNKKPVIQPFGGRTHQGWMGSKWRQRLTVEGKLKYDLVVLKKTDESYKKNTGYDDRTTSTGTGVMCASVPKRTSKDDQNRVPEILPQLMSGKGDGGGQPMSCISGWYCCNKGDEWYQSMTHNRTEKKVDYLHLDQSLFGHYMEVFARHLNDQYRTYPMNVTNGRFLDIGGTGSTASGMQQVTSKFQNFVGPLEYWKLDSDPAAEQLERTLYCDIDDCPVAETCSFDVTFSHTVLEHAKRPWLAFNEIARMTKSGGLTMHLVPWSYQYHATPGDNFRFSHTALQTLLEDRGFDVLEVGYDICTKQENKKKTVDEHYDIIWLSYVVGRKK
ncbi:methyltransferase domain containing protein [Nitzschia inconspicua]|uniref:Methyltransferase domain containing protein n=1 Tax=Nitzschia inconspicua TaxID=303405 RepID=A0A9K3LI29_9STRA|nr:methyltransferase domain containing protein [Nitzschia inconspicua]